MLASCFDTYKLGAIVIRGKRDRNYSRSPKFWVTGVMSVTPMDPPIGVQLTTTPIGQVVWGKKIKLPMRSDVDCHVTFYRGEVGPDINYQSCCVWYGAQNGTPHGGVYLPSIWRYEALKTQPLPPFNGPRNPCHNPWTQKSGSLRWETPMRS